MLGIESTKVKVRTTTGTVLPYINQEYFFQNLGTREIKGDSEHCARATHLHGSGCGRNTVVENFPTETAAPPADRVAVLP
jgi:hypothetical protein